MNKNYIFILTILSFLISSVYSQGYQYKSAQVPQFGQAQNNEFSNQFRDINANISTPLTIHLICHSHCDSGWLKTFDDYFDSQVKVIIDGVVNSLISDSSKKFIWSEVGFLEKWWSQASETKKIQMKALVDNGQLEFVGGGWVMNDEACPDIPSVINQITEGHQFLASTFNSTNARPVNGWQIDPFGHSTVTPALLSAMGYKHLVLNRIAKDIKESMRGSSTNLQFVWRGNPHTGCNSDILAHVLDDHYSFPQNFNSFYSNSKYPYESLVKEGRYKQNLYGGAPVVLIPMGDDFQYEDAANQFNLIDGVINFSKLAQQQLNSKVIIKYSTLRDYFGDLENWCRNNNYKFNQYVGDFFPYGRKGDWWTGYFTTRPVVKGLARAAQVDYRVSQSLSSQINNPTIRTLIRDSNRNISIVQHHDGITGTSKQVVMQDYTNRLNDAMLKSGLASSQAIESLTKLNSQYHVSPADKIQFIDSNTKFIPLIIVNSLGWNREDIQTIQITSPATNSKNSKLCPIKLMLNNNKEADYDCVVYPNNLIELSFKASVPAMGFTTVFVFNEPSKSINIITPENDLPILELQNNAVKLTFDKSTRLLSSVSDGTHTEQCQHSMKYYYDSGGAYSFIPKNTEAVLEKPVVRTMSIQGRFKKVFIVNTSPTKSTFQDISIGYTLKNTGNVEEDKRFVVDYHIHGENNEDIVSRFSTVMNGNSEYYTDNGLYLMKRSSIPFFGEMAQYTFPTVSFTLLNDSSKTFVCNSDRTRGTSSPKNGEFEFYVHRALNQDDNKGLGEYNNDVSWMNSKDQCYFSFTRENHSNLRKNALSFENRFRIFKIDGNIPLQKINEFNFELSPLLQPLPNNIHLLTYSKNENNNYLIRLLNTDDSGTVVLDLDKFFNGLGKYQIVETELTGMGYIENSIPFPPNFPVSSKTINNESINNQQPRVNRIKNNQVILDPYEIKTFVLSQ